MTPKKIIISIFLVAIIVFAGIANSATISDILFLPDKPFYFAKEWARSFSVILNNDEAGRIESRLRFGLEKLIEMRKVVQNNGNTESTLGNYLSEVERLKLASESLHGMNNDKLANKIVNEAYFERKMLADLLGVDVLDKRNYAITNSFSNFITSAFYIGSEDAVFASIKNHVDSIEADENKIAELDNVLAYSTSSNFREKVYMAEIEIVKNRIVRPFDNESIQNYFNSKLAELEKTDYYRKWMAKIDEEKQKKLISEIVKGEWVDEVLKNVPGEEVEILQTFKSTLAEIKIEKLDSKIDNLETYEETKEELKKAKNEIVASIYGTIELEQVMGVMQEERLSSNEPTKISPASAYCIRMGYRVEQRTKDGISYSACVSDDGKECEDLAFYKKECEME